MTSLSGVSSILRSSSRTVVAIGAALSCAWNEVKVFRLNNLRQVGACIGQRDRLDMLTAEGLLLNRAGNVYAGGQGG